jgi:hypothetical protein
VDRDGILALAGMLGSPISERRGNILISCPHAPSTHKRGTDANPAFSIKIDDENQSPCLCFGCGASGLLLQVFTEAQESIGGLQDAVAFIAENDRGGLDGALARARRARTGVPERIRGRGDDTFDPERYVASCSRWVPQYAVERGLLKRDIDAWRIGFDPDIERAVFPVWDEHGRVVGAGRRTIHPNVEPRYLDTPGLPKDSVFYGEHRIDSTQPMVHLVEGYLDTIFAARALPNVLGLMGVNTGIGPVRLAKLRRWARSVTLIFDGDQAGHQAAHGLLDDTGREHPGLREKLSPYFPVRVAILPEDADPASITSEALLKCVRSAAYLLP